MRIYLAGPMRGKPRYNWDAFAAEAERLRGLGHEVVSPAEEDEKWGFDPDRSIEENRFDLQSTAIRCMGQIVGCDAVFVLDGWEESKGAIAEAAIATWLGMPVYSRLGNAVFSAGGTNEGQETV